MLLSELHGYKRYANKTFNEILYAIKARIDRTGANSIVIVPRSSLPYVYKAWMKDEAYELYLELVRSLKGNPYVPKVGPTHKVPLFFKRQLHVDGYINVVKLEKLEPSYGGHHAETLAGMLQALMHVKLNGGEQFTKEFVTSYFKKSVFSGDDKLVAYATALKLLHDKHDSNIAADCRNDNIMLRGGSQLVVTDPVTTGYNRERAQRDSGVLFMADLDDKFEGELATLKTGSRPMKKASQ